MLYGVLEEAAKKVVSLASVRISHTLLGTQITTGLYISTVFSNFGYGTVLDFCSCTEMFLGWNMKHIRIKNFVN